VGKLTERELVFAEVSMEHNRSIRYIAKELGIDESTLRYRIERRQQGKKDGRKGKAEACEPFNDVIRSWLEDNCQGGNSRPESIISLYELLVSQYGYTGSYKAVVRYVRRRTSRPKLRPKRRVETKPGAQAQVDWATTMLNIADLGGLVKVCAFLMVLSFSRMWVVIWTLSQNMLTWLDCHNRALIDIGGIPLTLRIDNLKTGVSQGVGPWAEINPGYDSYSKQMGFIVNPCRGGMGSDKGKVERRVFDVKFLQVRKGESFANLDALQSITDDRRIERSRRLLCPLTGRSIYDTWLEEQSILRPLPLTLPTPFDVQVTRKVEDDCLVSFEGRRYQVPFSRLGRDVQVRGCPQTVEIYSENQLLSVYPRHTACRLLIDQALYEGEEDERVCRPTPLGELASQIVLQRSWDVPHRPVADYEVIARRLS